MVKNLPANAEDARDMDSSPGLGRSSRINRKRQLTPVFLPGKFHGQRSLACYSIWGHKESDATEHAQALTNALPSAQAIWMHKSGRVSALKKVINQQDRWT